MTKNLKRACLILLSSFCSWSCLAQRPAPVVWHFEARPMKGNARTLLLSASLAPGWHIYSQHLEKDGPIPTRFRFITGDDFVLEATTLETGNAHTFYDSLYGMDITWYSDVVVFQQNVRLINPVNAIRGTIEYMTCNSELCIPAEREFTIPLRP